MPNTKKPSTPRKKAPKRVKAEKLFQVAASLEHPSSEPMALNPAKLPTHLRRDRRGYRHIQARLPGEGIEPHRTESCTLLGFGLEAERRKQAV